MADSVEKKICSACGGTSILHCGHDLMFFCASCYSAHVEASHSAPMTDETAATVCACKDGFTVSKADGLYCGVCGARIAGFVGTIGKAGAETLTPMARAWLERFTPESWEGFPGYEPEVATAIRQALATIDAANAEIERLRASLAADQAGCSLVNEVSRLTAALAAAQREVEELRAERDDARAWVRKMVRETQELRCAFCGETYPPGTPGFGNDEALSAHIKVCAKHPLRAAEARCRDLEAQHEHLRQMVLTQGETIHEQEARIEALEAALAKAHGHINSLGDPCNDLVPGEGITVSERDAREALRFQTKRIEVLEAVLAKARRAIGEAAIPLEALRATEINGKALSPAVQAAIITATEAIRDALPRARRLAGGE